MKPSMSEEEAAQRFVLDTVTSASANWPTITEGWRPLLQGNSDPIDTPWALHEFVVANVTCRMRALTPFFTPEQADRLRDFALGCLATPDLKIDVNEAAQDYRDAFDAATAAAQPPYVRVAEMYFTRIGERLPPGTLGPEYRQPPLLLLVGSALSSFGGPWWKNVSQKYKLFA